jgi:hypothetical protein
MLDRTAKTERNSGPALTGRRSSLGAEEGTVLLIQVVGAVLLLAGSALIVRALVEIDAPTRPRLVTRTRLRQLEREDEPLRRAA